MNKHNSSNKKFTLICNQLEQNQYNWKTSEISTKTRPEIDDTKDHAIKAEPNAIDNSETAIIATVWKVNNLWPKRIDTAAKSGPSSAKKQNQIMN